MSFFYLVHINHVFIPKMKYVIRGNVRRGISVQGNVIRGTVRQGNVSEELPVGEIPPIGELSEYLMFTF